MANVWNTPYETRAPNLAHPTARKLFELQASKDTNVCLAADVTKADQLCQLLDNVGDLVSVVKVFNSLIEKSPNTAYTKLLTMVLI